MIRIPSVKQKTATGMCPITCSEICWVMQLLYTNQTHDWYQWRSYMCSFSYHSSSTSYPTHFQVGHFQGHCSTVCMLQVLHYLWEGGLRVWKCKHNSFSSKKLVLLPFQTIACQLKLSGRCPLPHSQRVKSCFSVTMVPVSSCQPPEVWLCHPVSGPHVTHCRGLGIELLVSQ